MPKVFITTKIPDTGIELLKKAGYEVSIGSETQNLSREEIVKRGRGTDALLCQLKDAIDGELMDAIGPQLKVIANYAVGYDNIDTKEAAKRNIAVCNTPDVLTESVAEHTVALILAIARRIGEADQFTRSGKWKGFDPGLFVGTELQNKVVGIVGHGRIGCRVGDILQKAFGMKVLYYDVLRDQQKEEQCHITYASLEDLLAKADMVSLHVSLSLSSTHILGEKELKLMKPTAYLINTSRGKVIDEKALVKALQAKQIQGAALDVFENEPKLTAGLSRALNVVLTPHIASATKETREKMAHLAAQNIIAVLSGKGSACLVP